METSPEITALREQVAVQISAIMSTPRLGFTCVWACIHTAIKGIPCATYDGCWWERGIQEHLRDCLKKGVEYCVTFDYDSIFTEEDFDLLMQTIVNNDHIDSISALQVRRGHGHALLTVKDKPGQPLEVKTHEPLQVATAHFGLTIIRMSALKEIPLPWLWNLPGGCQEITLPNGNTAIELLPGGGGWDNDAPGRIDADIYFWKKFEKYGRKAYVLPSVQIGHIEMLAAAANPKTGKATHYYISDFAKANRNAVEVEPKKEKKDEKKTAE